MKPLAMQPLTRPVTAHVAVPGSKSYTNRALLMAVAAMRQALMESIGQKEQSHAE